MSDNFLRARKIVLVFHGIDTFADISLNDHAIGEASNMFIRYTFDVTNIIKVIKETERIVENIRISIMQLLFYPEYAERPKSTESHISFGC